MEAFYRSVIAGRSGALPAALRALVAGASLPYRAGVSLRNQLYDRGLLETIHVPAPVVSIGNITLGGTGKTPFVELVCRWLRRRGRRVAILSRGYRSAAGRNDEALLLETSLPDVPHLQGRDRAVLAASAIH